MKVFEALRQKPDGEQLARRLETDIRRWAADQLDHVRDLFPHFTDHSIRHSESVIRKLDWLMPDSIKLALNEWELYFLLAATYLHDVGMVLACPGQPQGTEWEKFFHDYTKNHPDMAADPTQLKLAAQRDYIRNCHHERSEQWIVQQWLTLGLRASDTTGEAQIIGRIAKGHRRVDLSDQANYGTVAFGNNQLIHRDLLAAYLRLADELDTTAERTPWAEFEVQTTNDPISVLEWQRHLSTTGVAIYQDRLVISARCHDYHVYLKTLQVQQEVRTKLNELKQMIRRPYVVSDEVIISDPLPFQDVEFRIEHVGYLPISISFQLEHEHIAKLIMGERLYGDATACIRELLQNAVDTCREAKEKRPPSWLPTIVIRLSNDGSRLSVSDNGMGMNEHIVTQYFSRVGLSYYRSTEFDGKFTPTSEFGIGVLSCFMMADRIYVDTKMDNSNPIALEIHSITEPFLPSPGKRTEPGTTVTLELKKEFAARIDIAALARYYARHVDIPITILVGTEEVEVIEDQNYIHNAADVLHKLVSNPYYYDEDIDLKQKLTALVTQERIHDWTTITEFNGTKVGVGLVGAMLYHATGREYFGYRGSAEVFLSQGGFFVGSTNRGLMDETDRRLPLSFVSASYSSMSQVELNINGADRFELTAARTAVIARETPILRDIDEAISRDIEIRLNEACDSKNSKMWWALRLIQYEATPRYIPDALQNSLKSAGLFCVLGRSGFANRNTDWFRDNEASFYWVDSWQHENLAVIQNYLTESEFVIASPSMNVEGWSRSWWARSAGLADVGHLWAWYVEKGASVRTISISDVKWCIVESPVPLPSRAVRWRMGYDSLSQFQGEAVFDSHHGFMSMVRELAGVEWRRTTELLFSELCMMATYLNEDEFDIRVEELVNELKRDGALHEEYAVEHRESRAISAHACAYEV